MTDKPTYAAQPHPTRKGSWCVLITFPNGFRCFAPHRFLKQSKAESYALRMTDNSIDPARLRAVNGVWHCDLCGTPNLVEEPECFDCTASDATKKAVRR